MHRNFLLTGATGVVGLSIIEQLDPDDLISILVNNQCFTELPVGIKQQLSGDISKADFDLNESELNSLSDINAIIHCAALTDFTAELELLTQINKKGLINTLELAAKLNVPVIYLSTAFVKKRDGHSYNNYEQSKSEAEQILPSFDVPVTIVRPSIIIGDQEQGIMPKKQGIHTLLQLAAKELIPVVPGHKDSLVDVVPRDTVAKAILTIFDHQLKGEYWITAGQHAPSLSEVIQLGKNKEYRKKYDIKFNPPKIVSTDTFERLIKPVFMPLLPRKYKHMFEEASIYLKYLDMKTPFPSINDDLKLLDPTLDEFNVCDTMALNLKGYYDKHSMTELLESKNRI